MKLFSYFYNLTLNWSAHRHAHYYLAGVSFAESSFFPIPPDVMLISMGLATPKRAWNYALIATLFSVLGGIFGYLLGYFCFELIRPYIIASSYAETYEKVCYLFDAYGVWIVFVAGFSPIPYKVFTVAAGALQMAFFPFVIASLIGRGMRFFLVSALLFFKGEKLEKHIRRFIDVIGWGIVFLLFIIYIVMKWV